jgi:hypothetical protein
VIRPAIAMSTARRMSAGHVAGGACWQCRTNLRSVYRGVNLARSQAANIMGEDATGELPEFWDEIRSYPDRAIDAFVLTAIIFSHVDLIELLQSSAQGDMKGHLVRGSMGEKAYTNLVFAMASCGLCEYERGAEAVNYDMRGLVYELREAGHLVRQLIEFKLRKCGWRPPERSGTDFFEECEDNGIHRVFGIEPNEFRLRIATFHDSRAKPFGLPRLDTAGRPDGAGDTLQSHRPIATSYREGRERTTPSTDRNCNLGLNRKSRLASANARACGMGLC